jgi:NAD(P)-dependent dehydrogenase (short-subunit alcohol dehydrogenase family)
VALIDRDAEHLESVARTIREDGHGCMAIHADLSSIGGARTAAEELLGVAPRWDMLVHTAGNPPRSLLLETDDAWWTETYGTHVQAFFVLGRALAPGMIAAGGGRIIAISSTAGLSAQWAHGAYGSAKAALQMLTQVMAIEWGPRGVRANVICPTATLTDMGREVWTSRPRGAEWLRARIPAGRFAEVDDVVALVRFLTSPEAEFVNGTIIPCDGGMLAGMGDGPPPEVGPGAEPNGPA